MNDIIRVKSQNHPWAWAGSASRDLYLKGRKTIPYHHNLPKWKNLSGKRVYFRIFFHAWSSLNKLFIYLFKILGTKCLNSIFKQNPHRKQVETMSVHVFITMKTEGNDWQLLQLHISISRSSNSAEDLRLHRDPSNRSYRWDTVWWPLHQWEQSSWASLIATTLRLHKTL